MTEAQTLCTVCHKPTRKLLFNEPALRIPICSHACEQRYLDTLNRAEEARVLSHLDSRISQTKRDLNLCWATAGVGIVLILATFLTKVFIIFVPGFLIATISAFLTRHFEQKVVKLTSTRQRISI